MAVKIKRGPGLLDRPDLLERVQEKWAAMVNGGPLERDYLIRYLGGYRIYCRHDGSQMDRDAAFLIEVIKLR